MTGKERLLKTLRREAHDRVPFVPNIWQWFYHHKYQGTLPADLQGCDTYVQALQVMGADVIYKLAGLETYTFRDCGYECWFEGPRPKMPAQTERLLFTDGLVFKEKWSTPHGDLAHEWTYREMDGSALETGHIVEPEEFGAHLEAVRYWLEHREVSIDFDRWRRGLDEVGEDGLVPVYLAGTPLKQMHWIARQDGASYAIYDHPQELRELMRIHEEQVLAHTENVVDMDEAWLFVIRDNVDFMFYPPPWMEEFCLPTVKKIVDIVHSRGKFVFWHACGQLKHLASLIAESGVDSMEGQAPPPLGDWEFAEALDMNDTYLANGGMFVPYQELTGPDAAGQIDTYVRDLFEFLGDRKSRMLFGTSCNWSPLGSYENLVAFLEAVKKYGTLS